MANGNGNGNGGWDNGFWRFVRYATVIGGVMYAALTANSKLDRVELAVTSLRVDVKKIARDSMTKAEASRILNEANEVWATEARRHGATHRPLRLTTDLGARREREEE